MNGPAPRRNLVSLEDHATAGVVATRTSARRAPDAGMIPPVAPTLAIRRGASRLNDRPHREAADSSPGPALAAAVLGFFVITLDAVVVNVALPSIRHDLGGGITGLQWVVDGYTLLFAALLLSAGALSDRIGARRALAAGVALFVAASAACGLAPGMGALVVARFVQGAAAAVMMPATMALIGEAYPDPIKRARAVVMWAMGGALASSTGPVLGGLLTLISWRMIFCINLPVGALLAHPETFLHGLRASLLIAAGVALAAALVSRLLKPPYRHTAAPVGAGSLHGVDTR